MLPKLQTNMSSQLMVMKEVEQEEHDKKEAEIDIVKFLPLSTFIMLSFI